MVTQYLEAVFLTAQWQRVPEGPPSG